MRKLIIIVIILGSLGYFYWTKYQEHHKKQEQIRQQELTLKKVAEFAAKYDASSEWRQVANNINRHTIDFQKAFIRDDGKPILLIGMLDDIIIEKRKTCAIFFNNTFDLESINFVLECSPMQLELIKKNSVLSG